MRPCLLFLVVVESKERVLTLSCSCRRSSSLCLSPRPSYTPRSLVLVLSPPLPLPVLALLLVVMPSLLLVYSQLVPPSPLPSSPYRASPPRSPRLLGLLLSLFLSRTLPRQLVHYDARALGDLVLAVARWEKRTEPPWKGVRARDRELKRLAGLDKVSVARLREDQEGCARPERQGETINRRRNSACEKRRSARTAHVLPGAGVPLHVQVLSRLPAVPVDWYADWPRHSAIDTSLKPLALRAGTTAGMTVSTVVL